MSWVDNRFTHLQLNAINPTYIMKNLKSYNSVEIGILQNVRDQIKWHLGVELGHDPESTTSGFVEVEMRLAKWLTTGGGAWMASKPEVAQYK